MFISYTFSYIFLCLSLAGFVKDIFVKEICKVSNTDEKVITDMKVTYPVVKTNMFSLVKSLLFIDTYFFIFGSNYSIIASLLYIVLGIPIMFLINSIMSMGNTTYLHSRHTYNKECMIETRNPMYTLFCDDAIIQRLSLLLYIMTALFGRNEYVVFAYLFVPYCMALVSQINLDFSNIDEKYDLDMITENDNVKLVYNYFQRYESYTIRGVSTLRRTFFFLRKYLPNSIFRGNQSNNIEKNELGDIETYDTIPEAQNGIEELKQNNDVNLSSLVSDKEQVDDEESVVQDQSEVSEQTSNSDNINEDEQIVSNSVFPEETLNTQEEQNISEPTTQEPTTQELNTQEEINTTLENDKKNV